MSATHLVAGGASRFNLFGVMAFTEDSALLHAVRQIDQQLVTGVARETRTVPRNLYTGNPVPINPEAQPQWYAGKEKCVYVSGSFFV